MALSLGRRSFIDVLSGGQGGIGAAMLPPPERLWGMPPDRLTALPGYDSDVQKNRAEARKLMQQHGYGPGNPLAVKVAARNIPLYRSASSVLERRHASTARLIQSIMVVCFYIKTYVLVTVRSNSNNRCFPQECIESYP